MRPVKNRDQYFYIPTPSFYPLTLYHTIPTLNDREKEAFENIVGKGENAGNQHFLLFPQFFIPFPNQISIVHLHLFCHLQMV